jgi:hypothetical protein
LRYYFALIGAILMVAAAWLLVRRLALAAGGVATTGRVVAFEQREIDYALTYLPIVSFTDERGRAHRFTSVAGRSDPVPPVGSTVPVRYHPSDPDSALIASFLHMWAAPLGLAVLGLGSLLAFWQAGPR